MYKYTTRANVPHRVRGKKNKLRPKKAINKKKRKMPNQTIKNESDMRHENVSAICEFDVYYKSFFTILSLLGCKKKLPFCLVLIFRTSFHALS